MATFHLQTIKYSKNWTQLQFTKSSSQSFETLLFPKSFRKSALIVSSISPPSSKEEAILQAKTCLSTALTKPLNNPKLAGKLKKLKQPRFRLEIPIVDDNNPDSISQLALQILGDIPIKRKGSGVKILILWPNPESKEAADNAFRSSSSSSNLVENIDISSINANWDNNRNLNFSSSDVAVFLAPEASKLTVVKMVIDSFYPKPVVILNPRWAFDEESDFDKMMSGFLDSFEVVYSFTGLEVRGILSSRKGVIFKYAGNGEKWNVLVEEGRELKVVSSFKVRPSIAQVENVLYNLMAMNSPLTVSAKFLKGLVANVTGKNSNNQM